MTADGGSAGTAGRDYKVPPDRHVFTPAPIDHGQRPLCRCGSERWEHLKQPARRSA